MHVCDRARGDCKRSPACTVYGDSNTTASLRINMLARQNDTDFCGVYINDVSFFFLHLICILLPMYNLLLKFFLVSLLLLFLFGCPLLFFVFFLGRP